MYSVLVAPCGRGRLIRHTLGCVAGLIFLQCFFSLLVSWYASPASLVRYGLSAAASPLLALSLANGTSQPAGDGLRGPLPLRVVVDPGSKPAPAPAANVTATPAVGNTTSTGNGTGNGTASRHRPTAAPNTTTTTADGRHRCPPMPPKLVGRLVVPTSAPSWDQMTSQETFRRVSKGGRYRPSDCLSGHRVAIIVPYRDREEHLRMFLYHMHPVLQRQQLDYGIFIVEQSGPEMFNRASLLNAGVMEAVKQYDFQCFVFHDVDLLMEDDRNLYTCSQQPRHMSVAVDTLHYKLPYPRIFGGVSAMNRSQFELVNGFSNEYWGWGGEDDDMSNRLTFHKLQIVRYPANIARYKMIKHKHAKMNPKRFALLRSAKKRFSTDGLSSLKYQVKDLVLEKLYTRLLIDLTKW